MKKMMIVLVLVLAILPVSSAFAADTNLVSGVLFGGSETAGWTDGNESVSVTTTGPSGGYTYTFPKPVDVSRIRVISNGANYNMNFYDKDGKTVGGVTASVAAFDQNVSYKNVTSVRIYRVSYTSYIISEISIYGSPTNANPDASKFVINNLKTEALDADLRVSWDLINSTYTSKYNIYVDGIFNKAVTGNYSVVSGIASKSHVITVKPVDKFGTEYNGSTVNYDPPPPEPTPDTTPPDQVQGVKVQPSNTSALVTWTKSSADDLAGYSVYLDGQKSTTSLLTSESYQLTGLKAKTAYKVYVVAQDNTGNVSDKSDTVSFTTTNPTTDSSQEQTPDYILVTWTATPGAVSYEILLNGKVVGTAPADATTFKVTKAMGYNPQNMTNKTAVRAKFADGSTGGSNPGGGGNPFGGGWGFDSKDVWQNIVMLVGSLSIFLILGIVIKFAPRIFAAIRSAISAKKSY